MASVREIAKKAGVSAATVSRALNSHPGISAETRRRVALAANAAGYAMPSPAQARCCVGLVVDTHRALTLYDCLLLNGIRRGLHASRLDVQFVDVTRDITADESYTAFFQSRGLRGVIIPPGSNNRRLSLAVAEEGFPSVTIAERFDEPNISYVCCGTIEASERAIDHLIELGHKRIGLALPPFSDHDHRDRYEGYCLSLKAHGIELDESLIVRIDPTPEGGAAALNELLSKRQPPTAIFFADPYPAIGAISRAHAAGLSVPGQLSIIGFDDGRMRRQVNPMLSAVCQPTEELGYEAGKWLVGAVDGWNKQPLREVMPATLEINQTSGVPSGEPVRIQPDGMPLGR
ncbi:MAG: LacI family DNA-binding transcriptional regulator [Phycisphaerales bacterium]